jgi:hypothetical protein
MARRAAPDERELPYPRGICVWHRQNDEGWLLRRNPTGHSIGASAAGTTAGVNYFALPRSYWQWQVSQCEWIVRRERIRAAADGLELMLTDGGVVATVLERRVLARDEAASLHAQWRDWERALVAPWPALVDAVDALFAEPALFEFAREPGTPEPSACHWGHTMEARSLRRFVERTGLTAHEGVLWAMRHPADRDGTRHATWFRVSPDALVTGFVADEQAPPVLVDGVPRDFVAGVELKNPVSGLKTVCSSTPDMVKLLHAWEGRSTECDTTYIPLEYRCQVIYQAAVLAVDRIYFYAVMWQPKAGADGVRPEARDLAASPDFTEHSVEDEPAGEMLAVVHFTRSMWDWLAGYMAAMIECVRTRRAPGWGIADVAKLDPPPPMVIDYLEGGRPRDAEALWREHAVAMERYTEYRRRAKLDGLARPCVARADGVDWRVHVSTE